MGAAAPGSAPRRRWLRASAAAAVPSGAAVLASLPAAGAGPGRVLLVARWPPVLGVAWAPAAPDRVAGGGRLSGLPALALVWLRNDAAGGTAHVLWLLVVVWATDICAYLVGRLGRRAQARAADQPGKTWSGLLGGMAGAACSGRGLLAPPAGAGFGSRRPWAVALAVVAQAGDLFESALKRRAGVKDSGHLIPGHGGLLDRIDGLVFAAPVFAGLVGSARSGARLDRAGTRRPPPTGRAGSRSSAPPARSGAARWPMVDEAPERYRVEAVTGVAAGRRAGRDRPRWRPAGRGRRSRRATPS